MKYSFILFLGATLFCFPILAQKVSVEASFNYTPEYQQNYIESGQRLSYISFGRIERRIRTAQYTIGFRNLIRQKMISQAGVELSVRLDLPLTKRLQLQTGLGLNYQSFSLEQNIIDSDAEILRVDTLDVEFVDQVSGLCNEYTNSPPNFGEQNLTQDYQVLSLGLPLLLNYQLKENWQVAAGLRASVPIYRSLQREELILEQDWQREDYLVCTYILDNQRTRTENLSSLRLSGMARIQYQIHPKMALGLSAEQFFSDIFDNNSNPEEVGLHNGFEFRPLRIGLVINYKF